MSRPVRTYVTIFQAEGRAAPPVILETAGGTPCAAKNLGFKMLEWYLKQHPELPPTGWWVVSHEQKHA